MVDGGAVGVRPDGTPFLVHASAAPEYARGAIYGLVAGATFLREGIFADTVTPVVEHAGHLAASLMTRGRFVVEDFANRLEGAHPDPANLPVLILPLALFHASEDDERRAAIEALAAFSGADRPTVLAAHAMAGAIAAGTFDLAEPYDMAVAAVVALDGCEPGAARDLLRAELRRAVESEVDPGADV
ncbi:MAG: hypothetical protein JNJ59_02215, partial [Deltaproteobacteria bacterium]|nr:hypothetical protein [Deltaproteobacteria bacterium]